MRHEALIFFSFYLYFASTFYVLFIIGSTKIFKVYYYKITIINNYKIKCFLMHFLFLFLLYRLKNKITLN